MNENGTYTFDSNNAAYRGVGEGEVAEFRFHYTVKDEHDFTTTGTIIIEVTGVNDVPIATTDDFVVTGDTLVFSTSDLISNDIDYDTGEAKTLTVEIVDQPSNGTLVAGPNGTYTYTPNPGYTGPDTFTYRVSDGKSSSQPVTVTLDVLTSSPDINFSQAASGYGEVGGETSVNRTTGGDQSKSHVAALAGGGYVVVWTDASGEGGDSSGTCVKAQRFDAYGKPVGPEILVNTTTSGDQHSARVVGRADGGFTVVWADESGNGDIRAQDFSATGVPDTGTGKGEVHVAPNDPGQQEAPDVSYNGWTNRVHVVWTDHGGGNGADGRTTTTDTPHSRVIWPGQEAGDQVDVNIATWGHGGAHAAAWRDATSGKICSQLQNVDGTPSTTIVVSDGTDPDVACIGDKLNTDVIYVVSWTQQLEGQTVIRCQLWRHNVAKSPVITVDPDGTGQAGDSSIAALADGGFVVVWRESDPTKGDGSGSCIKVQRFDKDGKPVGSPEIVNDSTIGNQTQPEVTALPNGGYVVTWTDSNGDGSGSSIKSQIYGPVPPFQATEQEELNLAGKISIDDIAGAPDTLTVILTVAHGQIDATAGSTGAEVDGSGTGTVTITGTREQINALLAGLDGGGISYLTTSDTPPGRTVLTVIVEGDGAELTKGQQVITIVNKAEQPGSLTDDDRSADDSDRSGAVDVSSDDDGSSIGSGDEDSALMDEDLIPIPLFEHGAIAQRDGGDVRYLREALGHRDHAEDLENLLQNVEPGGYDRPVHYPSDEQLQLPDGFAVLDPTDPLFTTYAVIV